MKIAVYPGSFDPITYGHLDIIKRASKVFDKVIVSVLFNPSKRPMFDLEERTFMISESIKDLGNVEVDTFVGLLTDYAKDKNADVIIKGLRAVSDFEYEFQMALMNKSLNEELETMFMMTSDTYSYLSSSLVKEVSKFGGDISKYVPSVVVKSLRNKISGGEIIWEF